MISIQYLEGIIAKYGKCDRCTETSCRRNHLFVEDKSVPTIIGVPTRICPNVLALISDDKISISIRALTKAIFVDEEGPPNPTEVNEFCERARKENSFPLRSTT